MVRVKYRASASPLYDDFSRRVGRNCIQWPAYSTMPSLRGREPVLRQCALPVIVVACCSAGSLVRTNPRSKIFRFDIFQGKTNPVTGDRVLSIIIMLLDGANLGGFFGGEDPEYIMLSYHSLCNEAEHDNPNSFHIEMRINRNNPFPRYRGISGGPSVLPKYRAGSREGRLYPLQSPRSVQEPCP